MLELIIYLVIGAALIALLAFLFVREGRRELESRPQYAWEKAVEDYGDPTLISLYRRAKTDEERLEIANEHDGTIETVEDPGCGIFVYAGVTPNTSLYTELALEDGYIPTNEKMETAIPGVYAAGDIRVKQVRQVATAVADGAIAAINAAM